VHDDIIGIPFERYVGTRIAHPPVEGEMQEDVCQHRAHHPTLGRPLLSALVTPIGQHDIGPKPTLDIQQHPPTIGEMPHRS
jgi:hypothetical protein